MGYEKVRYDRILSSHRSGDGNQLVTTDSGDTKVAGNLATWDADGNITDSGSSGSGVTVAKAGTLVGTRSRINFIEGSNVTITATDDSGSDEVDVEIAASVGGGVGWTLAASWLHSVSGPTAVPIQFTGLSGANEIIVVFHAVTGATGGRQVQVSVDNGSSYYTSSGDYISYDAAGIASNRTNLTAIADSGAARTLFCHILNAGLDGVPKLAFSGVTGSPALFLASTAPVTAVQANNNAGGNLTGGSIYVLTR